MHEVVQCLLAFRAWVAVVSVQLVAVELFYLGTDKLCGSQGNSILADENQQAVLVDDFLDVIALYQALVEFFGLQLDIVYLPGDVDFQAVEGSCPVLDLADRPGVRPLLFLELFPVFQELDVRDFLAHFLFPRVEFVHVPELSPVGVIEPVGEVPFEVAFVDEVIVDGYFLLVDFEELLYRDFFVAPPVPGLVLHVFPVFHRGYVQLHCSQDVGKGKGSTVVLIFVAFVVQVVPDYGFLFGLVHLPEGLVFGDFVEFHVEQDFHFGMILVDPQDVEHFPLHGVSVELLEDVLEVRVSLDYFPSVVVRHVVVVE